MLTFRDVKGSKLTSAEGDANIRNLDGRLTTVEENPPTPIEITNVYALGSQMHVVLANATEFVFTMPQANFRPSVVGTLDVSTDGFYTVTNADSNRFWNYDAAGDATVTLPVTALQDMETTFCQEGDGAILFDGPTDVTIKNLEGFLNRTGGPGSVITAKFIGDGVWRLIGRPAEDVTA